MASMEKNLCDETKKIIRGLLTSSPYECNIQGLSKDFCETVGYPIPYLELGFNNVEHYLRSIPDTVRLNGYGLYATVHIVASEKSAHIDLMVQTQKKSKPPRRSRRSHVRPPSRPSTSYTTPKCLEPVTNPEESEDESFYNNSHLPKEIRENLKRLIKDFPNGILCTQVLDEYEKRFQKRIVYQKYNCTSVFKMCADLPKIFKFHKVSDNDYLLYDSTTSIKLEVTVPNEKIVINESPNEDMNGELLEIDWEIAPTLIPPDVMHLTDKIQRYFIGNDVQVEEYLDILVGEIYDPSKFYVYLREGGLLKLMKDLQNFYNSTKNRINIPVPLQEEGMYCISLFMGVYHRAVIINLLPMMPGQIRVLFVDYGTVGNVAYTDIFYLHKTFASLKCQAMRARLSNIYPPVANTPWSMESKNRFRELLKNRLICANITKIDRQEHILEIYLADITDEKNIFYINDVLVKEGYAIYADQEAEIYDFGTFTPVPKYIHLYPTFLEIETGLVPNEIELDLFIKNEITMDQYYPLYFKREYTENWEEIVKTHLDTFQENEKINFDNEEIIEDSFVDISIFPNEIWEDIERIATSIKNYKVRYNGEQLQCKDRVKQLLESDTISEYSCNRKRISDLISTDGSDEINTKSDERYTKTDEVEAKSCECHKKQIPEIDESNNYSCNRKRILHLIKTVDNETLTSDNNTILNDLRLKDSNMKVNNYKSTNPFLNDSNEYRFDLQPTNPFLYDLENTIQENKELFAKKTNITQNNLNPFSFSEFESKINKIIESGEEKFVLSPDKFVIPEKSTSPEDKLVLSVENRSLLTEKPVFREIKPTDNVIDNWESLVDSPIPPLRICSPFRFFAYKESSEHSPEQQPKTEEWAESVAKKEKEKHCKSEMTPSFAKLKHIRDEEEESTVGSTIHSTVTLPVQPVVVLKPPESNNNPDLTLPNPMFCHPRDKAVPPFNPQFSTFSQHNPNMLGHPLFQYPQHRIQSVRPPPGFSLIPPQRPMNFSNIPMNFNPNLYWLNNSYTNPLPDFYNFQFFNYFNCPPYGNPNFQNKS